MAEEAKNSAAAHTAEIEALKRQIEEMNKRLEELSAATSAGASAEGDSSALAASAEVAGVAEAVEPTISSEAPAADSGMTGSFVAETNASAVEAVPAPAPNVSTAAPETFEAFPNTPPIEKVVDDDGKPVDPAYVGCRCRFHAHVAASQAGASCLQWRSLWAARCGVAAACRPAAAILCAAWLCRSATLCSAAGSSSVLFAKQRLLCVEPRCLSGSVPAAARAYERPCCRRPACDFLGRVWCA